MSFPSSGAMDAMAGGGGPSTILPQIVTGQPSQILSHVEQVLTKATQFVGILEDLDRARTQLGQIWSGQAADSALKKIADSLQQFQNIIKSIQSGAELLQEAAKLVDTAQNAYRSIVGAVNPTVAALASNPWTRGAAHALATSASGMLRTFITGVGALLKALGITKLGTVLTEVAQIIGAVEQLFGSGTGATTGTGTGTGSTMVPLGSSPVTAPTPVSTVASSSGTQALAGGTSTVPATSTTPTATTGTTASTAMNDLSGLPSQVTAGTAADSATDWQNSYTPTALTGTGTGTGSATGTGTGSDNSWVPVDSTASGTHEATITASKGDLTVTVEVPVDTGKATDLDLNVSDGTDQLTEHVNIDADGTVKVS